MYSPDTTVTVDTDRQLSTTLAGVVVILGLEDGSYYQLEGVGVRVWELLQTPQRMSEIVERIVAEYDVAPETAQSDLNVLVHDLAAHRLVTVDVPHHS